MIFFVYGSFEYWMVIAAFWHCWHNSKFVVKVKIFLSSDFFHFIYLKRRPVLSIGTLKRWQKILYKDINFLYDKMINNLDSWMAFGWQDDRVTGWCDDIDLVGVIEWNISILLSSKYHVIHGMIIFIPPFKASGFEYRNQG